MPTYQYLCTQCGQGLEVQQSFSDDSLTVCPSCEGRLRKVFNAVGVVFKGSGFYRNDSRESPATTSGSAGESGSDTKTDTKPDAKSDSSSDSKKTDTPKTDTTKSDGSKSGSTTSGSPKSGSKASTGTP